MNCKNYKTKLKLIKHNIKESLYHLNEYVKEITGKEFRESGALWFVNSIVHLFGMAITWNPDTDEIERVVQQYEFEAKTDVKLVNEYESLKVIKKGEYIYGNRKKIFSK